MKLSPLAQIKLVAVQALALVLLGCEVPSSAGDEPPVQPALLPAAPGTGVVVLPQPPFAQQPLSSTNTLAESPVVVSNAVTEMAPEQTTPQPPRPPVQLSERLEAVVKLAQSGVEDDVILAFIQNSATPFNPTPDEIVYLTDVGLSDVVITALVNHRGTPSAAPSLAEAPPPSPNWPAAPPAAGPGFPGAAATYNPEPQVVYSEPSAVEYATPLPTVEYNYFYSSLAPYGSWVEVSDYGWCWQPTVAVVHHGWQPYCDRGRWLYTDCGYYWQSDYSWGWAPFHYGRWFHHPSRGWCWRPDSVWGPSWVAWRYTDSHCGWAPLPPGAHYHEGVGFTYYGAHVGVEFGFGLHHDAWTFVPAHRFHEPEVARHRIPLADQPGVFRRSHVANNYAVSNHTVVNKGIEPNRVQGLARPPAQKVAVRDLPERSSAAVRPDRLHQVGSEVVVYRPKPPVSSPTQNIRSGDGIAARSVSSVPGTAPASGLTRAANGTAGPVPPQTIRSRSEATASTTSQNGSSSYSQPARVAAPGHSPVTAEPSRSSAPQGSSAITGTTPVTHTPSEPASVPRQEQVRTTPTLRTPVTTPQRFQPVSPAGNSTWNQARAVPESAARTFPGAASPQGVVQPSPAVRQELPKPVTSVAPEKYNSPAPAYQASPSSSYSNTRNLPSPGMGTAAQPTYIAPQGIRPAPTYSPAPAQPRPAPVGPTYSPAPVQTRPSQPVQSYSAPVSRPAPQAAPAPTPSSSSNRRQY